MEATLVNLNSQQQYYATGKYDEALQINNVLIPEELPEENLKIVNDAYLNVGIDGEAVAVNYFNVIFPIAQQCPQAGGKAVSLARAFLSFYYPDWIDYDDENTCLQQGFYRQANQERKDSISKAPEFLIAPNPANTEIKISIRNTQNLYCAFIIYDMKQRLLLEAKIDCSNAEHVIDVSDLKQGLYNFKLSDGAGRSLIKKLAIIR